ALAAGTYLCAGGMDLSSSAGMAQAAWRYNQSDYYVALVLAFQRGYATGVFVLPSPPAPDQPARHQRKKHHHHAKHPTTKQTASPRHHQAARKRTSDAGRTSGSTSGKHTKPAPKPSDPTPSPTPTPTPTPSPTALSGTLAVSGSTYKLGGYTLDLGTGLSQQAPVDLDADGTVETWDGELQGLVGQNVKLTALLTGTTAKVLTVEGHAYP
ncbi:MAG TPA: hypothetical protein VFM09_05535, partial [Marmoricola sp.]|nr:hypothetical protein [Marmoricola sp.]